MVGGREDGRWEVVEGPPHFGGRRVEAPGAAQSRRARGPSLYGHREPLSARRARFRRRPNLAPLGSLSRPAPRAPRPRPDAPWGDGPSPVATFAASGAGHFPLPKSAWACAQRRAGLARGRPGRAALPPEHPSLGATGSGWEGPPGPGTAEGRDVPECVRRLLASSPPITSSDCPANTRGPLRPPGGPLLVQPALLGARGVLGWCTASAFFSRSLPH